MFKKILAVFLASGILFFAVTPALADLPAGNYGLNSFAAGAHYVQYTNPSNPSAGVTGGMTVYQALGLAVGVFLSLVEFIFFGMLVYAGIRWMTARGNEEFVTKAKETLTSAGIGFVLVLAAYALTTFIFSKLNTPQAGSSSGSSSAICPATQVLSSQGGVTSYGDTCSPAGGQCEDVSTCNATPGSTHPYTNCCPGGNNVVCCFPKGVGTAPPATTASGPCPSGSFTGCVGHNYGDPCTPGSDNAPSPSPTCVSSPAGGNGPVCSCG